MPRLPLINRSVIRSSTSASEMTEASDYFNREYVRDVILGDALISAQVQDKKTAQVQIGFSKYRLEYAQCTCHYFRTHQDWCRHIAATLLYVKKHEKKLEKQYERLMDYQKFDSSTLIELLDYLLAEEPMNSVLVQQFALGRNNLAPQAAATAKPHQELEDSAEQLQEFREELESALETPIIYRNADVLIGRINAALADQHANLALTMIALMVEAYAQQIPQEEDLRFDADSVSEIDLRVHDRYSEQLEDLAMLLNNALPIANLSASQAQEWIAKIESWLQVEEILFDSFQSAIPQLQQR